MRVERPTRARAKSEVRTLKTGRVVLRGMAWLTLREAVFERDGWRCVECGARRGLDAHHAQARSAGGSDELANLVSLCRRCHDLVQPDWRRYHELFSTYTRGKAGDGWANK